MDGYKLQKLALRSLIAMSAVQLALSYKHQIDLANSFTGAQEIDGLTTHLWPVGVEGLVIVSSLKLLYDRTVGAGKDGWAILSVVVGMAFAVWANGVVFADSNMFKDVGPVVIGMSTAVSWALGFHMFLRLVDSIRTHEEARRAATSRTRKTTTKDTSRKVSTGTGKATEQLVSPAAAPDVSSPATSMNTPDTRTADTPTAGVQSASRDTSVGVVRPMFPDTAATSVAMSRTLSADTADTGVPATPKDTRSKKQKVIDAIEGHVSEDTPLQDITAAEIHRQLGGDTFAELPVVSKYVRAYKNERASA